MASRHTDIRSRSPHGGELSMQTTTTDAPVLPIAQLAQLRQIAPDRVDWLFDETSRERRLTGAAKPSESIHSGFLRTWRRYW